MVVKNSLRSLKQSRKALSRAICMAAAMAGVLAAGAQSQAANILSPTDVIRAIDTDLGGSNSSYPSPSETPAKAIDGLNNTKYLNFGEERSGFIVTNVGYMNNIGIPSLIRSFTLTTANDADVRDPSSYILWGTNDAIISPDNSTGELEAWELISSGPLTLPAARGATTAAINLPDTGNFFASYKMIFPTVKNAASANSMQIAEVRFYDDVNATGNPIMTPGDPIRAIDFSPASSYPGGEAPANAVDGNPNTKYLNFGENNSGFIVTPGAGPSVVQGFVITTANDSPERDPVGWALYGTNEDVTSPDNTQGNNETWDLIDSGVMSLPDARFAVGPVVDVDGSAAYTSYRMVFTSVKNAAAANSMQIADIQFIGVVPEPGAMALGLLGLSGLAMARRRKA